MELGMVAGVGRAATSEGAVVVVGIAVVEAMAATSERGVDVEGVAVGGAMQVATMGAAAMMAAEGTLQSCPFQEPRVCSSQAQHWPQQLKGRKHRQSGQQWRPDLRWRPPQ